jgi:hypothetical protein
MIRRKKPAKPRLPKPATPAPSEVPPSDGLRFWATWSDGAQTKMSVYTSKDKLDLTRAVAVSTAAYSSRYHIPIEEINATIVQAQFRDPDGTIVATYDAAKGDCLA